MTFEQAERAAIECALCELGPRHVDAHALAISASVNQKKFMRCKLDFVTYKASATLFLGADKDVTKARGAIVAYLPVGPHASPPIGYGVIRFFFKCSSLGDCALINSLHVIESVQRTVSPLGPSEEILRRFVTSTTATIVAVPVATHLLRKILLVPIANPPCWLISDEHHIGLGIGGGGGDADDEHGDAPPA